MIEVVGLTKRYGPTVAVDDLTVTVRPGRVTGFLGPNGSGKSTTMRILLGLSAPSAGEARVGGRRYVDLAAPLREVGSLVDASAVHPGRSARDHLLWLARSNRIPARRVGEVLDLVGLAGVAGRRAGRFSLGMRQRLGIGAALLGDPPVLLLDEPVNGLDTEGIRWLRRLVRAMAAEGRTVFLSSHLMSEVELTADWVVVIGRGRLLADASTRDVIDGGSPRSTLVRPGEGEGAGARAGAGAGGGGGGGGGASFRAALEAIGATVEADPDGSWRVTGPDPATIGEVALAQHVALHELRPLRSSLEEVYSALTEPAVEHRAARHGRERAVAAR